MTEQLWICEYKKHMTIAEAMFLSCEACEHAERHEKSWNCSVAQNGSVCPACVPVTDTKEERDDEKHN